MESVLVSIYRHLWYLSEELLPLALCDDGTDAEEKQEIVKAMLNAGRLQTFTHQKPVMKSNLLLNHDPGSVKLHEFVRERLLFDQLDVNVEWVQAAPNDWPQSPDFQQFRDLIVSLKVVNDCAEHAVKDMTEYLNYCQDADHCEHVQMVVNHHRQIIDLRS